MEDQESYEEENIQLAENEEIEELDIMGEYEGKRELLRKTKIVKQTWSILEIYQKESSKKIILDPNYQRREIWTSDKKVAFVESLYMNIMIPPIYVVEIPGDNLLSEYKYEVVDGKQRLSTIIDFINNKFKLQEKFLEYFGDLYNNKSFSEIQKEYDEETKEMLSSVLDIYVITANSPEFTKYDIFARLNKGAAPLKVNEIRRAVYHSDATQVIADFIDNILNLDDNHADKKRYMKVFTNNDIKRFEDFGRFYKSLAFYQQSDLSTHTVLNYNSRPRDMINNVLERLQKKDIEIEKDNILLLIEKTLELMTILKENTYKEYLIDAIIPFVINDWGKVLSSIDRIEKDEEVLETFKKSPATTNNVNSRFKKIASIIDS
ncbi:DUF262 domain-containing protein [Campylobacterota bacterium DY0563]